MSGRFVAVCALGLAGSLFLGYCVYFDRNRRVDPDYKKKVLAREPHCITVVWGLDDMPAVFQNMSFKCREKESEGAG